MRSRIAVLSVCFALAVAAWAGDPWKEKTYKEWDEKDVNKILGDSPWARVISVPAFWRSGGSSIPSVGGRGGGGGAAGEGGGGGEAVSGGTRGGSGGGDTPVAHFTLRWGSARTVHEALARYALLHGAPEAEAAKIIAQPATEHQLILLGNDMTPFLRSDEKSLMEKSFVRPRKSKLKIAPSRVEIMRSQDGKRISVIIFHFAMKSEVGEPVIAADEKTVEFECRTDNASFSASFELQKMVSKAGPDLQ